MLLNCAAAERTKKLIGKKCPFWISAQLLFAWFFFFFFFLLHVFDGVMTVVVTLFISPPPKKKERKREKRKKRLWPKLFLLEAEAALMVETGKNTYLPNLTLPWQPNIFRTASQKKKKKKKTGQKQLASLSLAAKERQGACDFWFWRVHIYIKKIKRKHEKATISCGDL